MPIAKLPPTGSAVHGGGGRQAGGTPTPAYGRAIMTLARVRACARIGGQKKQSLIFAASSRVNLGGRPAGCFGVVRAFVFRLSTLGSMEKLYQGSLERGSFSLATVHQNPLSRAQNRECFLPGKLPHGLTDIGRSATR